MAEKGVSKRLFACRELVCAEMRLKLHLDTNVATNANVDVDVDVNANVNVGADRPRGWSTKVLEYAREHAREDWDRWVDWSVVIPEGAGLRVRVLCLRGCA